MKDDKDLLAKIESADMVAISIITVIEFLSFSGLSSEDETLFTSFCERVSVVDIKNEDRELISKIVDLRKVFHIKTPDAIICASALSLEAELISADTQLVLYWKKARNHAS